jgi:uncharacterized membrane protein
VTVELAEWLRVVAQTAANIVEGIGVIVVLVGIARTSVRYTTAMIRRLPAFPPVELRLELGRSLALALELLLGADILRTAVEPTWSEIGRLAAIAAIRTALNFFLHLELKAEAERTRQAAGSEIEP